jgi:hypothetical protein
MIIAAIALGALLAQATPPSKADLVEAHRRFQRGTELYEENNLAGALAEFRRAHALAPNYKVLYNIGQLCMLMQDNPCAYTSLSRYLDQGGTDVPAKRRDEVQRDLARLQSRVAKLRIFADKPGAEVTVDDVAVGTTPLSEPVLVGAGRPRIRVELGGYPPVTRVVEVAGMETASVRIRLAAPPPAVIDRDAMAPGPGPAARPPQVVTTVPPPPAASGGGGMKTTGIVLGVLGLAAVGGGVFSSLQVRSLAGEIDNARLGELDPAKLDSHETKARRYQTLQWVGYGAGAAALVTSIICLTMDGGGAQAALRVVPTVAPGGSPQLALAGRF